ERSQLVLDEDQVAGTCLVRKRIALKSVLRLGIQSVPALHFLHILMYGGREGTVLWVLDRDGTTTKFHVYMYQDYEDFLKELGRRVGKSYETLSWGWADPRWP